MSDKKSIQSMTFENLTFAYEDGPPVFEDISFAIPTARAVWVRSPGGRGKSTLLKILAGLLTPRQGRFLINGEDVNQMSFEEFLPYRLNMGYGFDFGGLLNNKTLSENLALPLLYHNRLTADEVSERIEQVVEMFGMYQTKDERPFAVSGSQRKLTCVLRAFMHRPQVVFLDDPMTGLKQDNLNDLYHFVEEAYASKGLKQMFFTSEHPDFGQKFQAEELLISADWFTTRSAA